jgi:hypothetical protein
MWGEVNINKFIEEHANSIICEPSGLTYNQLKETKIQKMMLIEKNTEPFDKNPSINNSKLPIFDNQVKQQMNNNVIKPKSIDEIHKTIDHVIDQKMHLFNSLRQV